MIQLSQVTKSYGKQALFEDLSFNMSPGERVGLVGRNGEGKSTIFKLILGEEEHDEGDIIIPKGYTIGHLTQHIKFTETTVIDEACLAFNDIEKVWTERYKVEIILSGLGFTEESFYTDPSTLSGGFQVRLMLGKVLIAEPRLLLLDEPTNYLDIVSIRWLKEFLTSWENEMIIITHDRDFMDAVTTHTMAINRRKVKKIKGDSAKLYEQISQEEEIYEQTRQNEQQKREQIEKFINRFKAKASKAKAVQSRVKALEKREVLEELADAKSLEFEFNHTPFAGKWLMHLDEVGFGYDPEFKLFEGISISVGKNDRIGIIGPNGRGKTTLLSLIAGERKPLDGNIKLSENLSIGYFGQTNVDRLDTKNTVEQEIMNVHPDHSRGVARSICGVMMFDGDNALKKIGVLSGGERSRVLLGKILVTPSNLLLLDEPTNHLDMDSIDSLIEALNSFEGALIIVTHSELMLHALANRLIVFDGGEASVFEGTYQDFLERVGWDDEAARGIVPTKAVGDKDKNKKRSKLQNRLTSVEKKIIELEDEIKEKSLLLNNASLESKVEEVRRLSNETKTAQTEIDKLFEEMGTLSESLKS